MIELVIKIPESEIPKQQDVIEIPLHFVDGKICEAGGYEFDVLPEGHGRLKDVDAFLRKVKEDREHAAYIESWNADDVLAALDKTYAPTVVEAEFSLTDTERSFLSKVQDDMNRVNELSKSKQKYGKHVGE